MTARIRPRADTAANWTSADPVLAEREMGRETDTGRIKYGDGTKTWTKLDYSVVPMADSGNITFGLSKMDKTKGLVEQTGDASFAKRTIGITNNNDIPTKALCDSIYATIVSPSFSGTVSAPTAIMDTETTMVATTAFVVRQGSSTLPLMNSTVGSFGISKRYARSDHVHPTDTNRQPINTRLTTISSDNTAGLLEQTNTGTIVKRNIGTTSANDVITLSISDKRYAPIIHTHGISDVVTLSSTLSTKANVDLTNISDVVFRTKAITAGVTGALPDHTGQNNKFLYSNGTAVSWENMNGVVNQTTPIYLTSSSSTTVNGTTIIAAYEQQAGQTLNLTYNNESDYEQENINGTDLVNGKFILHSTGSSVDNNTTILLHGDKTDKSNRIVDSRGITPFGNACCYINNGYISIGKSNKCAFGQQNFTVEFWFRFDNSPLNMNLLDMRETNNDTGLFIFVDSSNLVNVNIGDATILTAATNVQSKTWYHIAVVRNNGTLSVYVNGILGDSASNITVFNAKPIIIGALFDLTNTTQATHIDEFRLSKIARYTNSFTPHVIEHITDSNTLYLLHFNEDHSTQYFRDSANSGHDITCKTGAYISSAQSKFNLTSLKVGTGNACIIINDIKTHPDLVMSTDNFTLDFWFYPLSTHSGSVCSYGNTATFDGLYITYDHNTNYLTIQVSSNNSSWNVINEQYDTIISDNWNHIAISRQNTNIYVLLNGSLVSTYTISANSSLFFGTNKKWYIGGSSMNNAFNGYIDEFRIIRCDVRYTTNYTMPIAPYNTDDKTILLLHFNGNNNDTMLLDSSETSYCVTATTNNTVNCVFGSSAVLSTTQTRGGHSTSLYNDGTLNGSVSCIIDTSAHHGYPLFLGQYCDFCLELWVYVTNQTGTICTLVQTSTGKATFELFKPTFDTVSVILNKGETNSFTLSAVSVNVNAWNHIAIIRNECGHRLSINGILQTQSYNMSDTIMRIGDVRLIIGSSNASSAVQQYIDAIRLTHGNARYTTDFTPSSLINDADTTWLWIFNGSVGDTWVKELSNNTIAIKTANCYSVIDGVFITPYVNNSTTQYKFGSSSLTLPNQYRITLPYHVFPTGLQDFTIDFWMYATSVIGSQYVVDGRIGGDGAYPTIIIMNSSLVYWTNGSSKITTPFLSINIWKHIAVVRNNSITTMYIDGVNVGSATDTTVYLPSLLGIFSSFAIYPAFTGYIDEFRVSNTARWTTNFIPATTPFGNTYVTGPYKVLTTDNSQIDVSNFGVIDNCFIDANMPPGTSIKYLISFDGRITWQSWSGTAWNVVDITDIETSGNTKNQIEIGLRSWSNTLGTSIDVAVSMSTTNTNNTPEINNITITYGTYNLLRPGIDYTISRLFNSGVQQLTFTRLKNGNANHVLDIG